MRLQSWVMKLIYQPVIFVAKANRRFRSCLDLTSAYAMNVSQGAEVNRRNPLKRKLAFVASVTRKRYYFVTARKMRQFATIASFSVVTSSERLKVAIRKARARNFIASDVWLVLSEQNPARAGFF
jgi:hypothetical protein